MNKAIAVKFKAIIKKASLKQVLMDTFDLGIQLNYPQLANTKDEITIRGFCLLDSFEDLAKAITPTHSSFVEKLNFQKNLSYKLIEIDVEPVVLPAGAVKEVSNKTVKK